MTIEKIDLLRNIGQFDNVSPNAQLGLSPFALIYAENGRGKTTISSIFRSLGDNNPTLINERKRLGAPNDPHIVIQKQGNPVVFQNGSWNVQNAEIAVYDDAFVAENVCSGIDIQTSHRQNLHELILGSQGVALNRTLQTHVARVEKHNADLRLKGEAIPVAARGELTPNAFCALKPDAKIDEKITQAEKRLAAARSADAIRQRDGFIAISIPEFDVLAIEQVLSRSLPDLEIEAAALVKTHMEKLGDGGEAWVADGMNRMSATIEDASTDNDCPFCAQELKGSPLIQHYQVYFGQAYDDLKEAIRSVELRIQNTHGGDIPAAFERAIRTASQSSDFWKTFTDVLEINVDTAEISREWTAARDAILALLKEKAKSPLEIIPMSQAAQQAIAAYNARRQEVADLSDVIIACNEKIEIVKEQSAVADVAALNNDLNKMTAIRKRFEPAIVALCDDYLAEKNAKKATEVLRDQAREALDNYRENIFPAYEIAINEYLRKFNAGFRLGAVASVNTRAGSSASYNVLINNETVDLNSDDGPSFRNTLSAGDRNALALAFFFASLAQDANLAQKIVVIDDPMTSLDDHRSLTTIQEMRLLFSKVQQMIVLSHSKPFLCALWDGADKNSRSAIRIVRAANGSSLVEWDVNADSITEHDRRHLIVAQYTQAADPVLERQVATALRPILEAFMRVSYPESFPPGSLLGPFIGICRQRAGTNNQILSDADSNELRALLDYGNSFHHDTNPAWETALINDQELLDFSSRTLSFTSKN